MAKLLDINKARRVTTPEDDWYDVRAVCKQEDINAANTTSFKARAIQQEIADLAAIIDEGGPIHADEIEAKLNSVIAVQRDLIARFLLAWSHDVPVSDDNIALITKEDMRLIINAIGETVKDMRGVEADPKKAKPSDGSLTPLSVSPEIVADGQ